MVVFTSVNGVEAFFEALGAAGCDVRALAGVEGGGHRAGHGGPRLRAAGIARVEVGREFLRRRAG